MNGTIMPKQASPTASEYISDNFKPSDRIAVLVLNRNLGETTQRITTAQKAASPEFQAWLRYKNANGADIYVGMNPLKQDASTRTKGDIETIRHVYVDLDHGGSAALEEIKKSDLVPQPNYVLDTSPDKFQVVWKVEGMTLEEAEALQHAMVREFGGDPAATDSTRVLRLPGFANKKYDRDFYVQAKVDSTQTYHLRDFKVPTDSPDAPRHHNEETTRSYRAPGATLSQSEHDWAYAKRALARGDEPEKIIRRIADFRAEDKPDPEYYARHTVAKAQATLERETAPTSGSGQGQLGETERNY
jgi:RepB DNA-primase from phage plasmid